MKNVIITGPTGAVGMALIKKCIENGDRVFAVVRPDSPRGARIPEHPQVVKVECDLTEIAQLPEKMRGVLKSDASGDEKAFAFFHLAWLGTTGAARNDMVLQNANVRFALDAVSAAHALGCEVFVGAGSQAEYGRVEGMLTPDTPCFPENGYGMAKLCAGQMTRKLCSDLGMRHVWPRILSVYGPYDGEQSMVMSAVRSFKEGKSPGFTKGEQMWDYLYSEDAAEILRRLADEGKDGCVYPLGSGKVKHLADYIEIIRNVCAGERFCTRDVALGLGEREYAPGQVMYLAADITNIKTDLGFEPETSFEDGIRLTYEWALENPVK